LDGARPGIRVRLGGEEARTERGARPHLLPQPRVPVDRKVIPAVLKKAPAGRASSKVVAERGKRHGRRLYRGRTGEEEVVLEDLSYGVVQTVNKSTEIRHGELDLAVEERFSIPVHETFSVSVKGNRYTVRTELVHPVKRGGGPAEHVPTHVLL
jgi:hypothetical protein